VDAPTFIFFRRQELGPLRSEIIRINIRSIKEQLASDIGRARSFLKGTLVVEKTIITVVRKSECTKMGDIARFSVTPVERFAGKSAPLKRPQVNKNKQNESIMDAKLLTGDHLFLLR